MNINRRRTVLSRAVQCESLEGRMLLSLSPAGTEFRVNSTTANAQQAPAVASDADGDFVVVWEGNGSGDALGIFGKRYNGAGVVQGGEFLVNTTTSGTQNFAAVAMDPDGDFVVAWAGTGPGDTGGISAQRYNAAGTAQGGEFLVNTFTTGTQRAPSVAMDAAGNFVIAWGSIGQDGSGEGIYAQRFNASGVAQGGEFHVSTSTFGNQEFASLAMDADGNFVVVWQGPGASDTFGVFAQRYNAAGTPQGGEFLVNTSTTGVQTAGSIAMDSSGNFVVTWMSDHDAASSFDVYAQRFNASGAPQGGEFRVNTTTAGTQFIPSVAMDADGDFLVAWRSEGQDGSIAGVYAQSFSAAGVPQGGEFRVNTFTTGNQTNANVAMDTNGDAVVAWQSDLQDGSSYGVYAQRYDHFPGAPAPAGTEFRVNTFTTNEQFSPAIASDADGDFVVVWQSIGQDALASTGVYAQRYNPAGVPQGDEFRVNTTTTGAQSVPAVAMDADGDFVVVWNSFGQDNPDGLGIFAQRFNASGIAQGGEIPVNSFTTGHQWIPSVAIDADGDFVIVWRSDGQDPDGSTGVYAQRYNAAGVPQGAEFRVNTTTTNSQSNPTIAMDDAGNFIVAWEGNGASDTFGIFAQRYNAGGTPVGGEFRANTFTTLGQEGPVVGMDSTGNFVVTWESNGPDDNQGVFAQRYNSAGVAQGNEFRVNTFTTNRQSIHSVAMDASGNFVVVWESFSQESANNPGIYAQRYDAAGAAQGGEFHVNTFITGTQTNPVVAMQGDGRFVVAWDSSQQDPDASRGVYAQRFAPPVAAPAVIGSSFLFNTLPQRITFTFDQNVGASLSLADFVVQRLPAGPNVTPDSLSYDSGTNTATLSFNAPLADGNYRATALAASITNSGGTPMAADVIFNFFFLSGDANHDARVNLSDFNILAANFGQSPRNFSQGDFNYDTIVNLADFNILAGRFGQILAAPSGDGPLFSGTEVAERRRIIEELA